MNKFKIKLKTDLEFSENEMKEFLINLGYKIEYRELKSGLYWTNLELALLGDEMLVNEDDEYKKVFKKLMNERFETFMKNLMLK